jgi:glycosyltransferase involved in cell wall biosynthesis
LKVFDEVSVVSRVYEIIGSTEKYIRVDGPNVYIKELPFVRGALKYSLNYFSFQKKVRSLLEDEDCAILRLPSFPGFMLLKEIKKKGIPYAIEVIVDPKTAYKKYFFVKKYYTKKLKDECLKANGVSYVTEYILQKEYPSKAHFIGETKNYFESSYSSIDLKNDFFGIPKKYDNIKQRKLRMIHSTMSITGDNKGHTTLLKVVKELILSDIDVELICVGDGIKKKYYEDLTLKLGISNNVSFIGLLSNKEIIRKNLIDSDIFVFPTRAEGLPRVIIEAMSVGLPCISTNVNGIPELLPDEYLFDPDDIFGISNKIIDLVNSPDELEEMSKRNIKKALKYERHFLENRRTIFYKKLANIVEIK